MKKLLEKLRALFRSPAVPCSPLELASKNGWPSLRGKWLQWDSSDAWRRMYPGRKPIGKVVTRDDYPLMIETEEALIEIRPNWCFRASTLEKKSGVTWANRKRMNTYTPEQREALRKLAEEVFKPNA